MLCGHVSCPMNAAFKRDGYVGYCTVSTAVTIDHNGMCSILERLLKWFNSNTE